MEAVDLIASASDSRCAGYVRLIQITYAISFLVFLQAHIPTPDDPKLTALELVAMFLVTETLSMMDPTEGNVWKLARMTQPGTPFEPIEPLETPVPNREFFELIRLFLCDSALSTDVEESLKRLWEFFLFLLKSNPKLECSPKVIEAIPIALDAWATMEEPEKHRWLTKYFGLGPESIQKYHELIASSKISSPSSQDPKDLIARSREIQHMVIYTSRPHQVLTFWIDCERKGVNNENLVGLMERVEREESMIEGSCPICFQEFGTSQCEAELPPSDARPIKTPCMHIMCCPCFNGWTQSGSHNADLCPICRGELSTPDDDTYSRLIDNDPAYDLHPPYASVVENIDQYLDTIPSSMRDDGLKGAKKSKI